MDNRKKLGIIYGGRSGEHEVSLMSARSVLSVINREKFDVIEIGITRQGEWLVGPDLWTKLQKENYQGLQKAVLIPEPNTQDIYLRKGDQLEHYSSLDIVFPVMHGSYSEDGTLQGLFELADIAYVGAGVLGSAVCMDKGLFKHVMTAHEIPTLPYIVLNRSEVETDLEDCLRKSEAISPYPLFTKPANLGSSVGPIVEKGIDHTREIEISVLGNENPAVSVPGEVVPKDIFYTYEEKYIHDTAELLIPADLPEGTIAQIQSLAVKAYSLTDCAGMARVDFLIDRDSGELYLNEINTIPGFTQISMYPKLWEASGLTYQKLIENLIHRALERKAQRDKTEREFRT